MRTVNIVPRDGQTIILGRCGENKPTKFCFVLKSWLESYPQGNAVLWVIPPNASGGYYATTTFADKTLSWIPSATDLSASGDGKMELHFTGTDGTILKTCIFDTQIIGTLTEKQATLPEYIAPWGQKIEANVAEIRTINANVNAKASSASASATAAAGSAASASGYASAASASATSAAGSASDASASATSAAGSASSAESAKTAAQTAKSAAETAQNAAETASSNASTYASNASSSAQSAAQSAATASTAATTVDTKKAEALTAIGAKQTEAINAVDAKQTSAVSAVGTKQVEAVAAVQAIADQVPDWTDDINDLKTSSLQQKENIATVKDTLEDASEGRLYTSIATSGSGTQNVPAGSLCRAIVKEWDGKTVVWNQQTVRYRITNGTVETSQDSVKITTSSESNRVLLTTSSESYNSSVIANHKYLYSIIAKAESGQIVKPSFYANGLSVVTVSPNYIMNGSWMRTNALVTTNESGQVVFQFRASSDNHPVEWYYKIGSGIIVDLTIMFGSGNEPTTTDDARIKWIESYAAQHPEYNAGQLVSADVSAVKSVDDDDAVIDTHTIPSAVRTSYPLRSAGDVHDSISFDGAKWWHTKRVGADAVDGAYPVLSTPVVTDITSLMGWDASIAVESGGTVDFVNQQLLSVDNAVEYKVGKSVVSTTQLNTALTTLPKGVQVAGTDLVMDENGKVNVPVASTSNFGAVKYYTTDYYGIVGVAGGYPAIKPASASEIASRNEKYKPIIPSSINTAVTAALTDSNHLTMTDAQKDTACAVVGAWREPKWELIRTIECDGATKTYEVNDELISLYYAVYANANVSAPVINVQSYIGTVRDGTTRVLFHYISASNQTYLRKATGRCIKHGNMYTCELSSYVSNTNGAQIQRMHYGNIDDIITDDNIHYTSFGSSSTFPVGITIKVFGVRA